MGCTTGKQTARWHKAASYKIVRNDAGLNEGHGSGQEVKGNGVGCLTGFMQDKTGGHYDDLRGDRGWLVTPFTEMETLGVRLMGVSQRVTGRWYTQFCPLWDTSWR